MPRVLVLYYSSYGHIEAMAYVLTQVAEGKRLRQAPSARTMSSAATKSRSLRQGRECHGPRVAGQACDRDWW